MSLEKTAQKSELEFLLEKNASEAGLTREEHDKVIRLIIDPQFSEKDCLLCPGNDKKRAIYDTGMCAGHAYYALITRK